MNKAQKDLLLSTLSTNKHTLTLGEFSSLMSAYKSLFELELMPDVPEKQAVQNPIKLAKKKTNKKTSKVNKAVS